MYWKAIYIPNTILILEKCNSKNDWKTLCCCYVWRPTSNICNLSFAKSRKDHYLSKRSKYRIIYCHKITAFDKKKKEEEIVNAVFPMFTFLILRRTMKQCFKMSLQSSRFYTKKGSKATYIFEFSRSKFRKSTVSVLLTRESTILVSEIEARNHLPVSKSRSNKICQVLQQNCERLIMVA